MVPISIVFRHSGATCLFKVEFLADDDKLNQMDIPTEEKDFTDSISEVSVDVPGHTKISKLPICTKMMTQYPHFRLPIKLCQWSRAHRECLNLNSQCQTSMVLQLKILKCHRQ
jgi:hypothetical protein